MAGASKSGIKRVAENRKAFHDYEVIERVEAGVALLGTEAKSARAGHISLAGGFVRFEGRHALLCDIRIAPYEFGNQFNHEPERARPLLLHRREIDKLASLVARKGLAVIPLSAHYARGRLKVEIGLCRGRQSPDKREQLRTRTADREAERAMRARR